MKAFLQEIRATRTATNPNQHKNKVQPQQFSSSLNRTPIYPSRSPPPRQNIPQPTYRRPPYENSSHQYPNNNPFPQYSQGPHSYQWNQPHQTYDTMSQHNLNYYKNASQKEEMSKKLLEERVHLISVALQQEGQIYVKGMEEKLKDLREIKVEELPNDFLKFE